MRAFGGSLCVGAYQAGTTTGQADGWLCFWDPPRNKRRGWFGFGRQKLEDEARRIDEASRIVLSRLAEVLVDTGGFTAIRWHHEEDFMSGNEDTWADGPFAQER